MGVLPQPVWKCMRLLQRTGTKSIEGLNFLVIFEDHATQSLKKHFPLLKW